MTIIIWILAILLGICTYRYTKLVINEILDGYPEVMIPAVFGYAFIGFIAYGLYLFSINGTI